MLGRVLAAQSDLEKAIAELNRKFIPTPAASADQLHALATLLNGIGGASAADLPALRADVLATVAATRAAIDENRTALADAVAADALGLSGSGAARQQVLTTMATMQQFDPYLRFDSPKDAADYRHREDERRRYIDDQLAKNTPEGNLNASGGAVGQMVDAKLHGAGDSPAFQQRWDDLVGSTARLREEVRRSGGSTTGFDARLREDLRSILKAKGFTDAQIDARFAAHPDNPLEVARDIVASGDGVDALRADIQGIAKPTSPAADAPKAPVAPVTSIDDAMAQFRAAGIVTASYAAGDAPAHGVGKANDPGGRAALLP